MFKPLEIVGDTAVRTTDQKVRGSNPFERASRLANYFRNCVCKVVHEISVLFVLYVNFGFDLY